MGTILTSPEFRPLIEANQEFAEACFDIMVPSFPMNPTSTSSGNPIRGLLRETWLCHFHEDCAQCQSKEQQPVGGKRKRPGPKALTRREHELIRLGGTVQTD